MAMTSSDLSEPFMDFISDGKMLFSDGNINRVVYNNKVCCLELSSEYMLCTEIISGKESCRVKLSDIIGCKQSNDPKYTEHTFDHRRIDIFCYPKMKTSAVERCFGAPSWRRRREVISITVVNSYACENVINVIRTIASGLSLSRHTDETYKAPPPRRMVVFINPVGGTGRAVQIWTKESEPVFQEGGIDYEVILTERQNHARDICSSRDFDNVDGVVIVGGDGLIFEVVSGLFSRQDGGKDVMSRVPLIPIPGGSGNGLIKSILFECNEECNATTAAFVGVKGTATPLDISIVTTNTQQYYSFLMLGWVRSL